MRPLAGIRPERRKGSGSGRPRKTTAAPGSYALTGVAATGRIARVATATPGDYALTGLDALAETSTVTDALTDVGVYALTGTDATGRYARVATASPGSYVLTGVAANTPALPVAFVWDSVPGATSYVLQIGTAPGQSDYYNADVGTVLSVTLALSTGTYYSRVIPQGAGSPTPEQTVIV